MESEIQKYFAGKMIFLTGATGSLGKLVLEKILRTCFDVKKVWLLVRNKKGGVPSKRLKELLEEPVFGPLKAERPGFLDKISIVTGDCELPLLGLSPKDLVILKNEVNVIIHCAATVRFDEVLRKASYVNVRAVRDLLEVAKEMQQLEAFVHISTAYSNCTSKDIDEVFYESPFNAQKLLALVDALDDVVLDAITPTVIGKWPNTYTFTKAVTEGLIREEGKKLPLSIIRPSVVIASNKEPLPGWIDNVFGPTRVLAASSLGMLRTCHVNTTKRADLVPADYVVNAILATAWETGKTNSVGLDPVIYNYVNGCQNPLTWGTFGELSNKYAYNVASSLAKWYFIYLQIPRRFLYLFLSLLLHTVPAYVTDFLLYCTGGNPKFVSSYKKIAKFSERTLYFAMRDWNFRNRNTQNLWNKLNEKDRSLFEFDIGMLNWDEYFLIYLSGIRVYLLKDPLDTIPQAQRKALLFKIAHYSLVLLMLCSFLFLGRKFTYFL